MDHSSNTKIIPYVDDYWNSYHEFAKSEWGVNSYQAQKNYVRWLYDENPSPNKLPTDFLIVVSTQNRVVGCIHKLRMPWIFQSNSIEIPTIHNLVVDREHRGHYGLPLILKSLRADEYGIVPGTAPPLSGIFDKLKCQPIIVHWHRKVLRPFTGIMQLVMQKLLKKCNYSYFVPEINFQNNSHFNITTQPPPDILLKIANTLNKRTNINEVHSFWNESWLKWRFFHEIGPKHLLIYKTINGTDDIDFMIISLGPRHGLNVARLVEFSVTNRDTFITLLSQAENYAKKARAHVFLAYIPETNTKNVILTSRWKKIHPSPANTYFYHRNKECYFDRYIMSASTVDCGFEAIRG